MRNFTALAVLFALSALPAAAQDSLSLGHQRAEPGDTVTVPIYFFDESFTALGEDRQLEFQVQDFSIGVRPTGSFATSLTFSAAGVLAGLTPLFETTILSTSRTHWINAYDGASDPIPFVLDGDSLIGFLDVTISPATPFGTAIDLELVPTLTAVSNQGGSVMLNGANGGLLLFNGRILVDDTPLFADDFESGDTSAWTATTP